MKLLFQLRTFKFFLSVFALMLCAYGALVHAQESMQSQQHPISGEKQVMDLDQLQIRNALRFVPGQLEPYSGIAVSYFDNGMQKMQISFKNGRKHGKEVAWYENGKLRYVVRYLEGKPQTAGSSWYSRNNEERVAVSIVRSCDQEDNPKGFCEPAEQESSRIIFAPGQQPSRIEFTP